MNALWAFVFFLWMAGQFFGQVGDNAQGYNSTVTLAKVSATDRYVPLRQTDGFPASSKSFYLGEEHISYDAIVETTACGRFRLVSTQLLALSSRAQCLDTGPRGRGIGTPKQVHPAGTSAADPSTNTLTKLKHLELGKADSGWGQITFVIQSGSVLVAVIPQIMAWDYWFLEGPGFYIKIFLWAFNGVVLFGLVRAFSGAATAMMSGIGGLLGSVLRLGS